MKLTEILLNSTDPLFADSTVRLSQDGSCGAGTVPGSVRPATYGQEIHAATGDEWSLSDTGDQTCATETCSYQSNLGAGAFWCPLEPGGTGAERLKCECEQCPCSNGTGGFMCTHCVEDAACGPGSSCDRTMLMDNYDRRFSCSFSDALKRSPTYKLFWPDGWTSPRFFAQYFPSRGIARLDIINTMCSRRQPILMQCHCQECSSMYDEIDPLTNEQSGVCKQKKIPSPCARCETCQCSYPEDSWLGSITRTIVDGIAQGVYLGCEAGFESTGTCTALLDDLPAPLSFDCESGLCFPDNETREVFEAVRSFNIFGSWTTAAICVLFLLATLSLLLLIAILLHLLYVKRHRSIPLNEPGAPLAALAAAQAALGGFGSNPPGATLVFSWQNVNCRRNSKQVLRDVSGAVESSSSGHGALVALLGPSGSGKTTLLEALSGRTSRGDTATVFINGKAMSPESRRRHISFVYQDDILGATLTVREALEFSAAMRLRALSASQRAGRVSWALKTLHLEEVANSRIGDNLRRGVSGGERRRVAIGVELVVSPPIMFLDEPTTGLDASCALMLGQVLAKLAEGGRLLICSMHQPRQELMRLFDARLDLGVAGTDALVKTPRFLADKDSAVTGDLEAEVAQEKRGQVGGPSGSLSGSAMAYTSGSSKSSKVNETDGLLNPAVASEITRALSRRSMRQNHTSCQACVGDDLHEALTIAARATAGVKPANLFHQVFILWERSFREATRGSYSGLVAAAVVATVAVVIGFTFSDLESGVAGVQNRFGSTFFTQLFFSFFGLQACTLWYLDRDRLDRERASKLYHVLAYFISKASSYLWWYCLIVPAIYVAIVYPLIGFQASISKFMTFYLCTAASTAAASAVSLICLSITSTFASGISLAAIFITVLQMYAGFLQRRDAIPSALRWLTDVSPFAHAFAAMISSEFTGLETTVDATGFDSLTVDGSIWPEQFNVDPTRLEHNVQMLALVACIAWILALVPLWLQWYRVKKGDCVRAIIYRKDPGCTTSLEAPSWVSARSQGSAALVWKDLHAVLPNSATLYDGMNGIVQVGRPLAVLGPSGCGKTTLLSCLAGEVTRTKCDVSVYLNRHRIARSKLRRTVGYVRQDDALHPELTVSEAISFAVALRMPHASRGVCRQRVRWTIGRLGLEAVANSKVGGHKFRGISGGERRRTAVGVELSVARGVLALDEPTSGLDSETALSLGHLLSELAAEGCILLASMHQPSPELLANFSDTLVLGTHGRVAYFGETKSLPQYISPLRYLHPEGGHGVASDVLLDIISGDHANEAFKLYKQADAKSDMEDEIQSALTASPGDDMMEVKAATIPPIKVQLMQLLLREMRIQRSLATYTYFEATLAGLLLGMTYFQMSMRLAGVISRLGLIFAVHCTLGMQALQGLLAWREGYTSFRRERAAGYYYTGTFVVAKVTMDAILLRVGPPALMCLLVYLLAGLQPGREAVCCLGFCLASFVASTFCLALGATAPRSGSVLPLAVLLILLFLLVGGPLLATTEGGLRNISIFRASFNMLSANEMRGMVFLFDPEGVVTTLGERSGEDWMTDLGIQDNPVLEEVGWLLGWSFFYVVFAWLVLVLQQVNWPRFSLRGCCAKAVASEEHIAAREVGRRISTASE